MYVIVSHPTQMAVKITKGHWSMKRGIPPNIVWGYLPAPGAQESAPGWDSNYLGRSPFILSPAISHWWFISLSTHFLICKPHHTSFSGWGLSARTAHRWVTYLGTVAIQENKIGFCFRSTSQANQGWLTVWFFFCLSYCHCIITKMSSVSWLCKYILSWNNTYRVVQWSLYFKTTHGAKKMWSYIAGGPKIKVI